jgi:preprotein translocase subunit SecG
MQVLNNVVLILQILSAFVMIGLVLIQHGKGADMGASFGSGASGSLFGATGSANFLSRSTAVCASVFFVCTLALAFMSAAGNPRAAGGNTVLDRPVAPASGAGSAPSVVIPGAVIPGAASAPAAPASPAR